MQNDWKELFGSECDSSSEDEEGRTALSLDVCNLPHGLTVLKKALSVNTSRQLAESVGKQFDPPLWNQRMEFGELQANYRPLVNIAMKYFPIGLAGRLPMFDQSISNYYSPGQGLIAHTDLLRYEDGILVANLQGTCTMEFSKGYVNIPIFLDVGDVLLITGQARWEWCHGIAARLTDHDGSREIVRTPRISLTLRKLKESLNGIHLEPAEL